MPLASFEGVAMAAAAQRCAATAADAHGFAALLRALNAAASAQITANLAESCGLSEPFVARELSRLLPPGHGLFLGNSMPVRDMEMYAGRQNADKRPAGADGGEPSARGPEAWLRFGNVGGSSETVSGRGAAAPASVDRHSLRPPRIATGAAVGAPIAANRGASGIDGVLSTAAGQ